MDASVSARFSGRVCCRQGPSNPKLFTHSARQKPQRVWRWGMRRRRSLAPTTLRPHGGEFAGQGGGGPPRPVHNLFSFQVVVLFRCSNSDTHQIMTKDTIPSNDPTGSGVQIPSAMVPLVRPHARKLMDILYKFVHEECVPNMVVYHAQMGKGNVKGGTSGGLKD